MYSPGSFRKIYAGARARTLLLACALPAVCAVQALAKDVPKPPASTRPVARLVASTREDLSARQRARIVVASMRAVPSAAPVAAASGSERRLFDLINEERRARGRRPLVWDGELTRLARGHSGNMAQQRFFNHTDRNGLDLAGRAAVQGLRGWRMLAENIAYNQGFDDPEAFAVERWMISPKHRENILNGEFTHAGLGVVRTSDGTYYFTQVFMKR